MKINLEGRARLLGDDINTDYIISSSRKKESLDTQILKQYLLESVDPGFAASVMPGDIIVAGKNFGCGSAMEIASTVLLAAGIKVIVAKSFARTFYRNSVNNGLIPVECDTSSISEGDQLEVILDDGQVKILNKCSDDDNNWESIAGDHVGYSWGWWIGAIFPASSRFQIQRFRIDSSLALEPQSQIMYAVVGFSSTVTFQRRRIVGLIAQWKN